MTLLLGYYQNINAEQSIAFEKLLPELESSIIVACNEKDFLKSCFNYSQESCVQKIKIALDTCATSFKGKKVLASEIQTISKQLGKCSGQQYMEAAKGDMTPNCLEEIAKEAQKSKQTKEARRSSFDLDAELDKMLRGLKNMKASPNSLAGEYITSLELDILDFKTLRLKFTKNPKQFCPNYKGTDLSGCYRHLLKKTSIKSSVQFVALFLLMTEIAEKDRAKGYSESVNNLMAAESSMALVDRVYFRELRLAKLKPLNPKEKAEWGYLKKEDENQLATLIENILSGLHVRLEQLSMERGIASEEAWRSAKTLDLRKRLQLLQLRTFRYPKPKI